MNFANQGNSLLGVGFVGTALSAGTGGFVEGQSRCQGNAELFFSINGRGSWDRRGARADVGGEHTGVIEGSSYFDIAVIAARRLIDVRQTVFSKLTEKKKGSFPVAPTLSAFLFINKQGRDSGNVFTLPSSNIALVGRVSANAVVVAVAQ